MVAIPKTMDNDVPGTDYCIGFSTCVTRTIELTHRLRTSAGSHERILVIEVFGRYAGFTAMLPAMAGAADRCVIPEYPVDPTLLTELLVEDRARNPSSYSVVLVSEGSTMVGQEGMVFSTDETDQFGHKKLGGIGDRLSEAIKRISSQFNDGKEINTVNQRLGYLVRSGDPDALDSIVPMAFGNLALDLILEKQSWAPRGGPQRRILLGAHGCGGGEEGRGRGPLLQHRAAQAEVHHVRVTAVVHHDESDVGRASATLLVPAQRNEPDGNDVTYLDLTSGQLLNHSQHLDGGRITHRDDHPSARPQLFDQWLGDVLGPCRDKDSVERALLGPSEVPVTGTDKHVRNS